MGEQGDELTPWQTDLEGQVVRSILASAKQFPVWQHDVHRDWLLWQLAIIAKTDQSARHRLRATEALLRFNPEFSPQDVAHLADHKPLNVSITVVTESHARDSIHPNGLKLSLGGHGPTEPQ